MEHLTRRLHAFRHVCNGILAAAMLAALPAQAQDYPDRPVSMIVLLSAGGVTDTAARFFAVRMSEELGQPVTVDNRPGGSGLIGAGVLAASEPDGYTVCFCSSAPITMLPLQRDDLKFDPLGFRLIRHLYDVDNFLVVRKDLGIADFSQFVEQVRARPGAFTYGSTGVGSITHLGMALIENQAGLSMVHVPYQGAADVMVDILGGRLDFALISAQTASGSLDDIVVLASTGSARLGMFPDVPLISEFYPGYLANTWGALMAPEGTPDAVIEKLRTASGKVMAMPEVVEQFTAMGLVPAADTTIEELQRKLNDERARWKTLLEAMGGLKTE